MNIPGIKAKVDNTKAAMNTAQKVGKLRIHLTTHKEAYLAGAGCLGVGLLIGAAFMRQTSPINNIINISVPKAV